MRKTNKKHAINANSRKSEKENEKKCDKMDENAKRKMYDIGRPKKVLINIKNSATRSLSNVKNNLSMRMKRLSPSDPNKCDKRYEKFANNRTPLKLYSPFHIETPNSNKKTNRIQKRRQCHRQVFFGPMANLKEDLNYVTESINEMNLISEEILSRSLLSNFN